MIAQGWSQKVVALTGSFEPVLAPFDCDYVKFYANAEMKLRSDDTDANTEITIPASAWEAISAPYVRVSPRFPRGSITGFVSGASGTCVVTFVR